MALIGVAQFLPDDTDINPAVSDRIDRLERRQDCRGLQSQFDIADDNGNTDVMKYADDAMRDAGCYD